MIVNTDSGTGGIVSNVKPTSRYADADCINANSSHVGMDISACSGEGRKVGMTISRKPYDLNFVSVC